MNSFKHTFQLFDMDAMNCARSAWPKITPNSELWPLFLLHESFLQCDSFQPVYFHNSERDLFHLGGKINKFDLLQTYQSNMQAPQQLTCYSSCLTKLEAACHILYHPNMCCWWGSFSSHGWDGCSRSSPCLPEDDLSQTDNEVNFCGSGWCVPTLSNRSTKDSGWATSSGAP